MKYKVTFSGFAYVEADNSDEAKELFQNDEAVYTETEVCDVDAVDEFLVEL